MRIGKGLLSLVLLVLPALAQWTPDFRLTTDPGVSFASDQRCVAATGDTVHAVWRDDRDGNNEVYYKRSTDGGVTWDADTRLTTDIADSQEPSVVASEAAVHVVWCDYRDGHPQIYYKRSTDAGTSWGADVRLTNTADNSFDPAVAASGDWVHTVWTDSRNSGQMYYKRSTDGGATWGADVELTSYYSMKYYPTVEVSGASIHVAWHDWRDVGYARMYYKRSTDGGTTWGDDTNLTGNSSFRGSLAADGLMVHLVWMGPPVGGGWDSGEEIYYKHSSDAGANWDADVRLTNDVATSRIPSVAAAGDRVHVVWEDTRDGPTEVYYKRSTDLGETWDAADTRLTDNPDYSGSPSVVAAGDRVHVVWEDTRDGNAEMYYKRDTGLEPPTVDVTEPNGGEVLFVGAFFDFLWTQGGGAADYDSVYYSTDNGLSWLGLGRSGPMMPGVYGYGGLIPNTPTTQGKAKVVAYNAAARVEDVSDGTFFIVLPGGWHEMAPMPAEMSTRPAARGAWLAAGPDEGGTFNVIYAQKGNKTQDFCRYDINGGFWVQRTGMPYFNHPTWYKKPPDKGSRGVSDGVRYIYVTQGNNSLGWWRYDMAEDSWEMLPDVPGGLSGKKVKGGTDLAYLRVSDSGYVYVLKGYRTEFYRYNTQSRSWETLTDAPAGMRAKWDRGSWLCAESQNAQVIYAHKAKYHEFWRYAVDGDSWTQLTGMPFIGSMGRRKKSKDGGCAAWYSGGIYALKGGNTGEFWFHDPGPPVWYELDSMPSFGSTGKKKRVKDGGHMLARGDGTFYALKGNKTLELWRYTGSPLDVSRSPACARPGVMSGVAPQASGVLHISPNPLSGGFATVSYALPAAGPVAVQVYDVAGRERLSLASVIWCRASSVTLDLRDLSAGVYLVRLETDGFETTGKLIIER